MESDEELRKKVGKCEQNRRDAEEIQRQRLLKEHRDFLREVLWVVSKKALIVIMLIAGILYFSVSTIGWFIEIDAGASREYYLVVGINVVLIVYYGKLANSNIRLLSEKVAILAKTLKNINHLKNL